MTLSPLPYVRIPPPGGADQCDGVTGRTASHGRSAWLPLLGIHRLHRERCSVPRFVPIGRSSCPGVM
jgi:hypothetical protein